MLVLTRKTGQKVIINNNIEVTILEARGDTVKIGIDAPRDISIYREEIYQEIRKANEQSKNSAQADDLDQAFQLIDRSAGPESQE